MFLNYFADDRLASPANIAVGRVLLAGYLIWKTVSFNWTALATGVPRLTDRYSYARPSFVLEYLGVEAFLAVVVLVSFAVGYRQGLSAYLACLLVSHLGIVRFGWNFSGGTTSYFIAVYFMMFYGLYREYDTLTVDSLYRSDHRLDDHNRFLQSSERGFNIGGDATNGIEPRAPMLKWSLVTIALIYFGSAFGKATKGPLWAWIQPGNLVMHMQRMDGVTAADLPLNELFVTRPLVAGSAAVGTVLLEAGFLLAVLAGFSITVFVLGLYGMVAVVALSMGPFFFDVYLFLALFADWERIVHPRGALTVVYDEHCSFCARSLLPFALMDGDGQIAFQSQYEIPEWIDRSAHDFEAAIHLFADGRAYRGYYAFARLVRAYPMSALLGHVMRLGPVAAVGKRVYRYVTTNRSRHFTCEVEEPLD